MPTTAEKEELAEQMRIRPTSGEQRMAFALLKLGSPVEHQYLASGYILDFAIEEKQVAIEVDGKVHEEPGAWARDRARDLVLMREGWSILHVSRQAMELEDWQGTVVYGLTVDLLERHHYEKPPLALLLGTSGNQFRLERMQMSSDVSLSIGVIEPDTLWRDQFHPESALFAPDFERVTPN